MRQVRRSVAVIALGLLSSLPATAQQGDKTIATQGPQFLVATTARSTPKTVDPLRVPLLARRISVDLREMTVAAALGQVADLAGATLVYGEDLLPSGQRVHLKADEISVAAALTAVLVGAGIDVVLSPGNRLTLIKRGGSVPLPGQGAVTGRITDAKVGAPVANAEVLLADTRWRTTTDTAGRYQLKNVDAGTYTLTVRRFGYEKQSRSVTVVDEKTDTVDLAIMPVVTRLNELVSTATGERRRVELTTDVTTINADSVVRTQPISSVTQILDGRVPGLTVQHASGAPGDPARLLLRGAGSPLQSNDPIVIVDGVRTNNQTHNNMATGGRGSYATPSPLDYIDPASIEKIEVIKGPSASTLYGPDAANGVIVITTKKGQAGPARWDVSAEHGRTNVPGSFPDLWLRWGHAFGNNLPVVCPINNKVAFTGVDCSADSTVRYQLLNDPALTPLDDGRHTQMHLGVSGGSSALRYSVQSFYRTDIGTPKLPGYEVSNYQSLTGLTPPDWMQRPQDLMQWSVQSSLSANLGAKTTVTLSNTLGRTVQQRSPLENQLGQLMATYFDSVSGDYYVPSGGFSYGTNVLSDNIKLATGDVLTNYYQQVVDAATNLHNGVNVSWRPQSWLTVSSDAGLDYTHVDDRFFLPQGLVGIVQSNSIDTGGVVNYGRGTTLVGTFNAQAAAKGPLGRGFQFQVAAGVNYRSQANNNLTVLTTNVPVGTTLIGSTASRPSASQLDDATFGWYIEPAINNARFYLNLGLRLDGGSSYGSSVSGLDLPKFPKLGFGYLVSDESFYPFKDVIPDLKIRASYGKASRQPGPTDQLRLYQSPTSIWVEGGYVNATQLRNLGNTDLRPEVTGEFEGGFDASIFSDRRLSLTVTGYRKTTEDALLNFPVAPSVNGGGSIFKNIGVIRNTGLNVDATMTWIRNGSLTWSSRAAYSRNRNVVVKLGPGIAPFYAGGSLDGGGNPSGRVAPGYPLFSRWTQPIVGYADANGDGIVSQSEIILGDTAVYVGATQPNYQIDFSSDFTFLRAFTVSATLQYQNGFSQINSNLRNLVVFSSGRNDSMASLAEQVATSTSTDYNWIQTVNTLRFNALSVSYRVPASAARRMGAQTMSVLVQGTNLGLHTNYRGLDPDVGRGGSDDATLPLPRLWQIKVAATY